MESLETTGVQVDEAKHRTDLVQEFLFQARLLLMIVRNGCGDIPIRFRTEQDAPAHFATRARARFFTSAQA